MSQGMLAPLRKIRDRQRRAAHNRLAGSIDAILSLEAKTDTRRAEADFERLQASAPSRGEYGYDPVSLLKRAAQRATQILGRLGARNTALRYLEVAPGDGTLGSLFAAAGHDVDLCDLEDWRTPSAKALKFQTADCCVELPYPANTFDVVSSFNSMEHMADPRAALDEMVRVTRPDGLIYLDFGPLYCSPWGLHAYRSLKMPYPQFLFSDDFIAEKLRQLGISDLGTERSELQYVNKWRPLQFSELWSVPTLSCVDLHSGLVRDHLELIRSYPEAFRGRGLSFEDVICDHVTVAMRKTP